MDPLSIAASAAGLLSIGITICKGLLDYYKSLKDAEDDIARMYTSIEALTKTLILIQSSIQHKSFNSDIVIRVEESIASTQDGIESLRKKLDKIKVIPQQEGWRNKTKAQFRKKLFPFKESTLAKLKELGNELQDSLSIALDVLQIDASASSLGKLDILSQQMTVVSKGIGSVQAHTLSVAAHVEGVQNTLNETSNRVSTLVSTQNDAHSSKIYNWLSPLAGTFEKKQLDTFNLKGRQDGKGNWLLGTTVFNDWLQGVGKTLWCPGIPGAGKTVLTSFIVNYLQSLSIDIGIAYIYCAYKEAKEQTLENLLASLVHQLIIKRSIPPKLEELYSAHIAYQTRPSISEYTDLLQLAVQSYDKVLVVIDALDECVEVDGTRKALVNELQKLKPKANLLVTSRDMPNIQRLLGGGARLDIQASENDIRLYIQDRISGSDRLSMYVEEDPDIYNSMTETIIGNAKGMFLQVRLHLDSLSTKTTMRKLKSALHTLPEGLEETYDEVWRRIESQNRDDAELATRVIYWIFYAIMPLTVAGLQHALAVEPGDTFLDNDNITSKDLLVSACAGLVLIQQESGTVEFVHQTTQEYFERTAAQHFPSARKKILRSCLTYLLLDEIDCGFCYLDQETMTCQEKWPFLQYASYLWSYHARGDLEESEEELVMKVLKQDFDLSSFVKIRLGGPNKSEPFTRRFPRRVSELSVAARYGLCHMVRVLLAAGADVTLTDDFEMKPLGWAAVAGHDEVVRLLLEHRVDQEKDFALLLATCNGRETVVRVLLEYGTDVNATAYGTSSLFFAARRGDIPLVELLVNDGLSADLAPFKIAVDNEHDQVVQILLDKYLDVDSRDSQGRTALHYSCANGRLFLFEQLLRRGSDPRALDEQNRTCLHHAASAGSAKILSRLLEEGLDPMQMDIDHWTPLHWAAKAGSQECVKVLVDASGKQTTSLSRWDPHELALFHGHFETAKLLSILCQVSPDPQHSFKTKEGPILSRMSQLASSNNGKDIIQSMKHSSVCDGCERIIYGPRYRCTVCDDFDFCFKCILSSHKIHPSHEFKMLLLPPQIGSDVKIERSKLESLLHTFLDQ